MQFIKNMPLFLVVVLLSLSCCWGCCGTLYELYVTDENGNALSDVLIADSHIRMFPTLIEPNETIIYSTDEKGFIEICNPEVLRIVKKGYHPILWDLRDSKEWTRAFVSSRNKNTFTVKLCHLPSSNGEKEVPEEVYDYLRFCDLSDKKQLELYQKFQSYITELILNHYSLYPYGFPDLFFNDDARYKIIYEYPDGMPTPKAGPE